MNIQIKKATEEEVNWVNNKYDEIQFQHSDLKNEMVVIATVDGQKAGIGRLVKINDETAELGGMYVFESFRGLGVASEIVKFLLKNKGQYKRIFCLPFENLKDFYGKYGFKIVKRKDNVPEKILEKHAWCNKTYDKKVLLLSFEEALS